MFYKKQCSVKFYKIHRKTPVSESIFNKVAGLRPATALKKNWCSCFPVNFAKFFKTSFQKNHSGPMLLKLPIMVSILFYKINLTELLQENIDTLSLTFNLVISRFTVSRPLVPKVNSKFEILPVKIFNLKQKANQILPAIIGKIKFCLFKKTALCSFRQKLC